MEPAAVTCREICCAHPTFPVNGPILSGYSRWGAGSLATHGERGRGSHNARRRAERRIRTVCRWRVQLDGTVQNGEFWAVRSLESEGLVITRPGRSVVVTS